jgi:large subunit ribosomal protein L3
MPVPGWIPPRPIDVGIVNKGSVSRGLEKNHESERKPRIAGPQGGHDAHLHGRWRRHSRDGARRVEQPRHPGQDRRDRRLQRPAGGVRRAQGLRVTKPEAGHLAKAGVEAGESSRNSASPPSRRPVQGRCHRAREPVRRRPEGRRAGHLDRQGLRRHHQAPQLQLAARVARQQPFAQRAGLDLDGAGPGPRVPGQEDDRSHGRRDRHHAEPRHRPRGRSASLLLVRGAVPGSKNGHVVVRPAIKAKARREPRTDATRAPERTRSGHVQGRRARHRVRA